LFTVHDTFKPRQHLAEIPRAVRVIETINLKTIILISLDGEPTAPYRLDYQTWVDLITSNQVEKIQDPFIGLPYIVSNLPDAAMKRFLMATEAANMFNEIEDALSNGTKFRNAIFQISNHLKIGKKTTTRWICQWLQAGKNPAATDQNGQEVWRWKSDAFGLGSAINAPTSGLYSINLRFPGQYYDSESGLHYNYFRDYDPQTGRYVESDPIGLNGGLNTYGYVEGNPTSRIDFWGLASAFPGAGGMSAGQLASYGQAQSAINSPQTQAAQARAGSTWQNPYAPDYFYAEASAYVMSCSVTYTKYGDTFCGCGFTRGYPSSGFGVNASAGFVVSPLMPSRSQLNNYLDSYGASAGYYSVIGGGVAGNTAGGAINVGVEGSVEEPQHRAQSIIK
jgi:RHS repeat-associated protein